MAAAVLLGFDDSTAALLFYEIVEGAGLLATLPTRFEPRVHEARARRPRWPGRGRLRR